MRILRRGHITRVKRHEALHPLTHDHHHHALRQARLLREDAGEGAEERLERAREFLGFFEHETRRHFREEEEVLFAAAAIGSEELPELLVEALIEHVRIHALVAQLHDEADSGDVAASLLAELGKALEAHVRLEENQLFPLLEKGIPEERLRALRFAPRERSVEPADDEPD